NRAPGIYELEPVDVHAAIAPLPDTGETLYLIYNVHSLELEQRRDYLHVLILITTSIVLSICGIFIALIIARRIIRPVTELSRRVRRISPDKIPDEPVLTGTFTGDEVGILAEVFDQFLQRIHSHIERERQFTRFASHELRSPVTVIKGAVEVLESRHQDGMLPAAPVDRIRRAVDEMENTIESFLLLSRERIDPDRITPVRVQSLVKELADRFRPVSEQKNVSMIVNIPDYVIVDAHYESLKIAIGNLVRNAVQFTAAGTIHIDMEGTTLRVTDTGCGIESSLKDSVRKPFIKSESSPGYGMGLAIVDMICSRFGWQFEIAGRPGTGGGPGTGTCASISFSSDETRF
ncbi:MAG TPA: HAMP domain-containing sensor histidine kinase, partial [bacterium]|nr:HAMP domain-containing sensor histidine kinase [bacterium]